MSKEVSKIFAELILKLGTQFSFKDRMSMESCISNKSANK